MMDNIDYPALYLSTDKASNKAQKAFLRLNFFYLLLGILGTIAALFSSDSKVLSIVSASLFLCGLFLVVIILTMKYENRWYSSRAKAESIKTATWRFMMKAEPFESQKPSHEANSDFRKLLQEIIEDSSAISDLIGGEISENEQITNKMKEIRELSLEHRRDFYLTNRIDEQRKWYANKYKMNKKINTIMFLLVIFFNLVAGILAIIKTCYPTLTYLPIDIFAVIAVSSMTWIQLKKFQDLISSYALAAHEIGIIRSMSDEIDTEDKFSSFVIDSENAFSREHTQWIAKRTS